MDDRRLDAQTGERARFRSVILPPWCRKSPKVAQVLPLLYLHGLSSGDFVPALEQFLGSAAGLSPATVTRLTQQWQADHAAFMDRDLAQVDYVYVWADGIHRNVRLEEAKACVLVLVGVCADGSKELIALKDGYRESGESWADLLRDCARRGMRAPVLAVGDGALGFWKALAEVFPGTREQRCWVHKTANVLDVMPKSAQPGAKKAIQDIYNAEDKQPRSRRSPSFTARGFPRPSRRSPTTRSGCWRSTPSRPSTGPSCAPRMKVSRPVWRCSPVLAWLGSAMGVVDPGAKSRVVGLEALPRSFAP